MSKADDMFKELGFEKEEREYAEVYVKRTKYNVKQIGFNKLGISIQLGGVETITISELQAINEKVKELGWNE